MGRKTVRWKDLKQTLPGWCSCDKCNNCGIIQDYDWIDGETNYFYCDCYYGKQEKERVEKYVNGTEL